MRFPRTLLFAALLLPALLPARADKLDDYAKARLETLKAPGFSVAVVKGGAVVAARGYGLANIETNTPATPDTVYQLASVTKQFTAAAAMLLIEDGKLKLEDSVTTLLPDLPEAWKGVTVRHLLNHTSGIKSVTGIPGFLANLRKDYTKSDYIKQVTGLPLEFQPGEKWAYNNSGYYLLGMVIEKASGKSYEEFLTERVFKPLGMNSTRLNSWRDVIANRAAGYDRAGGGFRNAEYLSPTQPYAAGSLISTVNDMAKWDRALSGESLLKKSSLEQMWAATKLNDGKTHDYGFGWGIGSVRGRRMVEHGGGIPGFSTQISRFLDDKLTVIVLCNRAGANVGETAQEIAALYVPGLGASGEKIAEDPEVTRRLRAILETTAQDKLDPEQFTPEMRKVIFPDNVKRVAGLLRNLGALKAVKFVEGRKDEAARVFRYRAEYEKGALSLPLTLDAAGKVSGFAIQPEQE